jgi:hypothetical protein
MKSICAVLLIAAALHAHAQQALEIIPLRHRTVEQVVPALQPLLEPGGTLAGQANQLIVRTSPANLAELRRALEAIDRPLRRLQISVRFDDRSETSSQGLEAGGRISNRSSRVDVRAHDNRSAADERVDQRLQVLEGGRAFIASGHAMGVPQRQLIQTPAGVVAQQTIVVHETATGFDAVPRLSGSTVFLDIAPQRETPGGQFQRASTTVSGRLGEWFELGGVSGSAARDDRGILSANRVQHSEARRIWVKVEEIRP